MAAGEGVGRSVALTFEQLKNNLMTFRVCYMTSGLKIDQTIFPLVLKSVIVVCFKFENIKDLLSDFNCIH